LAECSGAEGATLEARVDVDGGDGHDHAARGAACHVRGALFDGQVRRDASLVCRLVVDNAKAPLDA
jgi:hypothetical protein